MTMTYVAAAGAALEAELERSDHGGNPPELLDLYTLLVLTRGVYCSLKDVHDAWAMWRLRTRPDHRDLVPFDQLADEVKTWDAPYRDAIAAAARSLDRQWSP